MEKYAGHNIWRIAAVQIAAKKGDLTPPRGSKMNPRPGQEAFEFVHDLVMGNRVLTRAWITSRYNVNHERYLKALYDFVQKMVRPGGEDADRIVKEAADYIRSVSKSMRIADFLKLFGDSVDTFEEVFTKPAVNQPFEEWSKHLLPTPEAID